jgi:3-hydroxy-3-methylglutaryl CoA synthase
MVGIISSGVYVPMYRLTRSVFGKNEKGVKAIGAYDEDSITMGVTAAVNCLGDFDRQRIDALFFATTTSPYKEKMGSVIAAYAIDLRRDIVTADFGNSLRAGTLAIRAALDGVRSGSLKNVLVVVADCRLGSPRSKWESICGDGAAALLIGDSEEILAEIESSCSVCDEMMDVWRTENDRFIRSAEERFLSKEAYGRVCIDAINGLLKKSGSSKADFSELLISLPDTRAQADISATFGIKMNRELVDYMSSNVGDTGVAYPLMLLHAALETSEKDRRLVLVSYGSGSDALLIRIIGNSCKQLKSKGIGSYLACGKTVSDYQTYLRWREIIPVERPPRPLGLTAAPALWRETDQNLRMLGGKCKICGSIQFPPQRVCTRCHSRDNFERVRMSDRRSTLFTYSMDFVSWAPEVPTVTAIVNFEGGGRAQCLMADVDTNEIQIDMPLEMTLRKMDFREGINIYSWKCKRTTQ